MREKETPYQWATKQTLMPYCPESRAVGMDSPCHIPTEGAKNNFQESKALEESSADKYIKRKLEVKLPGKARPSLGGKKRKIHSIMFASPICLSSEI
jgi:hypothetical protein